MGVECRVLESWQLWIQMDPGPVCPTLAWRCSELASLHPHHPCSIKWEAKMWEHGREGSNPTSQLDFLQGLVQLGLYPVASDLLGFMAREETNGVWQG